ncbi:hypothetical protein [Gimesia algae]|uniref:Uncharacterized protein n=1 Tax=Gimesia algae TaxID=2527971 RepID=A0A517VGQ1_9PLAN|nr:hypothetical protein [Gimesia algae]QDT92180.1 hypothetical protein Pan161_38470 [Gimesia algae]
MTVGDLFAQKYGCKTELVSSVVQALGYLFWMCQQVAVSLLSAESLPTGTLATALTVVPPELTGLLASIAGYMIGQWISPVSDISSVS